MNEQLMKSVLALDVYNRGLLAGMAVSGTSLGNYAFQRISLPSNSQVTSFAAAAYLSTNGSTVISYRGTDA